MGRPRTKVANTGSAPPVRELGTILGGALSPAGMAPWSKFVDDQEFVPELIWPGSVQTYEGMRCDAQAAALYKATVLGIMRMRWSIDPAGAEDEMVEKIAKDYNLPILGEDDARSRPSEGEPSRRGNRRKRRFQFPDHQRKAFYAGIYGHYFFEQVGFIGDDGLWHLKKLAERPPRTIQDFHVAEDGGLVSITQNVTKGGLHWGNLPEIPVDRLVGYVWDREGANWAGRSWFRELYKNYVIKDRLMRIDAINHERAGGVPYIEAHPGATYAEIQSLNEMASKFRIGDTAGGAVPAGAKLNIAKGTNSSVVESIRYHDEAMARFFMLMVMQLAQTSAARGSYALGTTFIDFWAAGLYSLADWFRDTFNEHVVEDDIDWNYGEDIETVPLLHYEADPEFSVEPLARAVDAKIIVMDDELENYARKEMGLTRKRTPRLTPQEEFEQETAQQGLDIKKTQAEQSRQPAAGTTGAGQ